MFKDVFVLRKDAWHAKLMKYLWGFRSSDFTHMCPYFWLTVLNIIIFPFWFTFKQLIIGLAAIGDFLANTTNNAFDAWEEKQIQKLRSDPNFEGRLIDADFNKSCGKIYERILERMYSENFEKYHQLKSLHYKRQKEKINEKRLKSYEIETAYAIKRATAEQKERERKQQIAKLTVFFKPVLKVLLYLIAAIIVCVGLYGFYHLILAIASIKVNVKALYTILITLGIIFGIAGAVIGLGILGYKLVDNSTFMCKIGCFFKKVFKPVAWCFIKLGGVVEPIGTGIGFIIQMFKDQCPAIKWEDK